MKRCSKNKKSTKGIVAITFAVGLLISCFCPPKFLVAVLALWVIVLGITCSK